MPRARLRPLLLFAATSLAVACGSAGSDAVVTPPPPPVDTITTAARAYLDTALLFMQSFYYYGDTVNWGVKRNKAFTQAGAAKTFSQLYPAIDQAVRDLGDKHSYFYPPSQSLGFREDPNTPFYHPMTSTIAPRTAYLWVPTFGGTNLVGRADTIQRAIAHADSTPGLCGWILDLRGNPGGFWPSMLAGLSPLITPGKVGGFVERDTTQRYFYEVQPGVASFDTPDGQSVEGLRLPKSYQLVHTGLPIAILQGDITASAGEIIVMAFKEPARTVRTFGAATYGATTQPYTWVFPDTASEQIAAALMFDRQRHIWGGQQIPADQQVAGPTIRSSFVPGSRDAVIDAATSWLGAQTACTSTSPDRAPTLAPGGGWQPSRAIPGAIPAEQWTRHHPSPLIAARSVNR